MTPEDKHWTSGRVTGPDEPGAMFLPGPGDATHFELSTDAIDMDGLYRGTEAPPAGAGPKPKAHAASTATLIIVKSP